MMLIQAANIRREFKGGVLGECPLPKIHKVLVYVIEHLIYKNIGNDCNFTRLMNIMGLYPNDTLFQVSILQPLGTIRFA
jgi:hypothetical protein